MNALVIGASAGLGRALASKLAESGCSLYLVASDGRDLAAVAADLRLRHDIEVHTEVCDLTAFDAEAMADGVIGKLGAVDALFLIAGFGDDGDDGPVTDGLAERLMAVNFTAPVRIANAFRDHLASRPRANCVGIGSVAAIRGRTSNVVYGAAKRGLEFYFESLRSTFSTTACRVQFYRVGFMRTSMLGDRKTPLPVADPAWVAARIVANLDRDLGIAYLPGWWRWIAIVLEHLPWAVFRRLANTV